MRRKGAKIRAKQGFEGNEVALQTREEEKRPHAHDTGPRLSLSFLLANEIRSTSYAKNPSF
jgi:RNA:NAD 2'-phosphotransferase (TPT1/KptA family)